jgi:hypothetical protein
MSEITIQVPAEHVEAIRASLARRRDGSGRDAEIERLLAQLSLGGRGVPAGCELTGARPVLWSAVYDSVCATAERLADECNEYWRGVVDPASIRATLGDAGARFELLAGLGPPPG